MNMLTEAPPDRLKVGGAIFLINSDFRMMIRVEGILAKSIPKEEKAKQLLPVLIEFYKNDERITDLLDDAVEQLLWFYKAVDRSTTDTTESPEDDDTQTKKNKQPSYSYEHDGGLIYSAFLDQYNMDLITIPHLHWWIFVALLDALRSDCEFKKVIGYRTITITNDMSDEQKKTYRELKRIYKLPDHRTPEEIEQEFAMILDGMF